jgi:predicted RNase H-like HicB family nuclease
MLKYHAAYFQGESGWIVAKVLDFPGALSQGRTLNSARRMLRDALRVMAETLIQEGTALPRPNPKARDKAAIFQDVITVKIQVPAGAKD